MKQILLLLFVLLSLLSFSQTGEYAVYSKPAAATVKTHGYIKGVRLDSIDAKYGEVALTTSFSVEGTYSYGFEFRYGQQWNKSNELKVTDNKGSSLEFEKNSIALALNFFDYNGWELVKILDAPDFKSVLIVLKKKQF